MSAYSTGVGAIPGTWSWPEESPGRPSPTHSWEQNKSGTTSQANVPKPKRERHWRPRTCRICLDTVLPTFHPPSESLAGIFQGEPSVTYDSPDGRLVRPCRCRGSAKYVHESCLQQWRHADPSYGRRNFWQCPTCHFQYRLERMRWGRWISSTVTQIVLTVAIFMAAVFVLGFFADPIINLYVDPYRTISSLPSGKHVPYDDILDDEGWTWSLHFLKGFASLGLIGFIKVFFTLSPWQWWNLRGSGFMSGSGRPGNSGRDRLANISWLVVVLGISTVLYTVWKGVRAWSRKVLEKAGERVVDVQGDDEDDDDDVAN